MPAVCVADTLPEGTRGARGQARGVQVGAGYPTEGQGAHGADESATRGGHATQSVGVAAGPRGPHAGESAEHLRAAGVYRVGPDGVYSFHTSATPDRTHLQFQF